MATADEETEPEPTKVTKAAHQPALALSDAPEWFADLRARSGIATRALEFLTLTAARSGEVRGATWAEIDLDAGLWIVPAARMKAEREHRVPLTKEAVDLLKVKAKMLGEGGAPLPNGTLFGHALMENVSITCTKADAAGLGTQRW